MVINNLAIIKILMIRPSHKLGLFLLLFINKKRDFRARKNVHKAIGGRYVVFFALLTFNNTPKELNRQCKDTTNYINY
jgi:hypothetical protein